VDFTSARKSSTWASSGTMFLTGDPGGPPLAISWPEAERLDDLARRFGVDTGLLGERAAAASLGRLGRQSCGGKSRLLRARDAWVALSIARDEDLELLPAMVGVEALDVSSAWPRLIEVIERHPADEIDERAELLGASFSIVGRATGPFTATGRARPGARPPRSSLVADLTGLWAGPLCTHLLQLTGATVIKIEDKSRLDGARRGTGRFYDVLNWGKLSVLLDFRTTLGRSQLLELLAAADVIVTSSRARAFDQLGIMVEDVLATSSDKVWTAITAYGWSSNRVGYGDDVAAGSGLVAWHPVDRQPRFAADAIADPLCGLEAAALTLDCLAQGGRWFVDASLAGAVAASVSPSGSAEPAETAEYQHGCWLFEGEPVEEPRARVAPGPAAPPGADTARVLARLAS